MDFETRAIHAGQEPDPATGAITTPIYQTSTYVQEAVGVNKGYDYARVGNPTRTALQVALASLENAAHGIAFSSGLTGLTLLRAPLSSAINILSGSAASYGAAFAGPSSQFMIGEATASY